MPLEAELQRADTRTCGRGKLLKVERLVCMRMQEFVRPPQRLRQRFGPAAKSVDRIAGAVVLALEQGTQQRLAHIGCRDWRKPSLRSEAFGEIDEFQNLRLKRLAASRREIDRGLELDRARWLARQCRCPLFQEAAVDLVAPIYIGAPLGMLVALHALAGWKGTFVLIATIVVSDSAQYYTGRAFGRRRLAPAISPKKTIEGAIGGVVFGTLFMVLALGFVFPATPMVTRVLLGAIIVLLGIIGDLFESRLKRLAGMKDSSALIPGHGGVLDRIDALLFAIPVFYFMVLQGRVA